MEFYIQPGEGQVEYSSPSFKTHSTGFCTLQVFSTCPCVQNTFWMVVIAVIWPLVNLGIKVKQKHKDHETDAAAVKPRGNED